MHITIFTKRQLLFICLFLMLACIVFTVMMVSGGHFYTTTPGVSNGHFMMNAHY